MAISMTLLLDQKPVSVLQQLAKSLDLVVGIGYLQLEIDLLSYLFGAILMMMIIMKRRMLEKKKKMCLRKKLQ